MLGAKISSTYLDTLRYKRKGYADMLTDDDLSDLLHDIIHIEQRYQSEEFSSNSSRIEELIVDAYETAEADHHKGNSDEA